MTKDEKLAYAYGKSFDIAKVPENYAVAPCFDVRLNKLMRETRSESGVLRNHKVMQAWWDGLHMQPCACFVISPEEKSNINKKNHRKPARCWYMCNIVDCSVVGVFEDGLCRIAIPEYNAIGMYVGVREMTVSIDELMPRK